MDVAAEQPAISKAIRLGVPPTKDQSVSRALQDAGIFLIRAPYSKMSLSSIPQEIQAGYSIYINSIPKYIEANLKKASVPLNPPFFPVLAHYKLRFDLPIPPISVDFSDTVPVDKLTKFKHTTRLRGKKTIYDFVDVGDDFFVFLKEHQYNRVTPVAFGTVNVDALNRIYQSESLLHALVSVQNYPAFLFDNIVETNEVVTEIAVDPNSSSDITEPQKKKASV